MHNTNPGSSNFKFVIAEKPFNFFASWEENYLQKGLKSPFNYIINDFYYFKKPSITPYQFSIKLTVTTPQYRD